MTLEQQILENNKIIAEFMGLKSFEDGRYGIMYTDPTKNGSSTFSLNYHDNYGWLMPVVEYIEQIDNHTFGFTVDPWGIEIIEYASGKEEVVVLTQHDSSEYKPIDKYYDAVVEFVKWYKVDRTINQEFFNEAHLKNLQKDWEL